MGASATLVAALLNASAAFAVDVDRDPLFAAATDAPYEAAGRRDRRDGDSFYVTSTISTLGIGLEVSRSVAQRLALRVGASGFDYTYDNSLNDIDYEVDLRLRTFGAHVDWHPGGGGAFLTGGVLYNGNEVTALGAASGPTIDVGDLTFTAEQVGNLTGDVTFNEITPVVGAGWNTAFAGNRVGVHFAAGVVFQGQPVVGLQADGTLADEPLFQDELEKERADLEEDLESFRFYPVASIGLTFRF